MIERSANAATRNAPCERARSLHDAPSTRVLRGSVIGALLAALLASVAPSAHAQAKLDPKTEEEVQRHFQLGNKLYGEGNYQGALAEYDAAYELSKNWKILYNRGQCQAMLHSYVEAIDSLEQYLKQGGDQIPEARRKEVENDLVDLRNRLGTIAIENAPPGCKVLIGNRVVGFTPLGPVPVGPGPQTVTVLPPPGASGPPFVTTVKITSKMQAAVRVEFSPTTPAPAPVPAPVPVAPPPDYAAAPPPPKLPPRPPGGLTAPSIDFALQVGTSIPSEDYAHGDRKLLGAAEISATWRASPFWEIGVFGSVASGKYGLKQEAISSSGVTDYSRGQANVASNADYGYGTLGLRARMHIVRTKAIDGWFGLDFGSFRETWKFTGSDAFEFRASSAAFALALGADIPLSRSWAIGAAARFLSAGAGNGRRENCSSTAVCAEGALLPGEIRGDQSSTRTFFELGLRLVFLLPLSSEAKPEAQPEAKGTAKSHPAVAIF